MVIRWGVCFRIRIRPSLCGCGGPSAFIVPGELFSVCGCGVPSVVVAVPSRREVCGCGTATATVTPRLSFKVCGCGLLASRITEGMTFHVCGCGRPASTVARVIRSSVCGCGKPTSTEDTDVIPAGTICAFGGITPPAGWLLCDGSVVSQTTYAALYAAIGTRWVTGTPGAGNFNVPDLRQWFIRGWMPGGTGETAVGGQGGNDSQTLTVANLPPHTHPGANGPFILGPGSGGSSGLAAGSSVLAATNTGSAGSGTFFDNRPFFKCVSYIIKT